MSKFEKARRETLVEPLDLACAEEVVQFSIEPLIFSLKTEKGPYADVDLKRYRDGDGCDGIMGFPELIGDLLPVVRRMIGSQPSSPASVKKWISFRLPLLFTWLTRLKREIGSAPGRVAEFEDTHGELLKRHVLGLGGKLRGRQKQYSAIWRFLTEARGDDAPPLDWPSIEVAAAKEEHPDVDPRAVKALYNASKRVLDDAFADERRGRAWLDAGIDPRLVEGKRKTWQRGKRGAAKNPIWHDHANLAVLAQKLIRDRIVGTSDVDEETQTKLNNHTGTVTKMSAGVTRQELLAAIAPTPLEVAASVLIVSMETGWIDSVGNIDLTNAWYILRGTVDPHALGKTDTVVLQVARPKTRKMVTAVGMAGSRFRSYQIIRFMEKRTAFLRECLRERRDFLAAQPVAEASRREIAEIDARLKTPWLYFYSTGSTSKGTELAGLMSDQLKKLRQRAIASLKPRQQNDDELIIAINKLKWSDMRDAFATHVYENSGNNIFLVKQALGHADVATTRAYLRQRRQILQRFDAFRDVVETFLTEVDQGRSIDPTLLFLANNYKDFGKPDREKLFAFRTRMEMGCANPSDPERHLAPNHPHGARCAVQRCILCRHGIVFRDAFEGLADRHADLVWLRSRTPPNRWLTSTLSWELEAIEFVRDRVFASFMERFAARSEKRLADIKAGQRFVFDDPEVMGGR